MPEQYKDGRVNFICEKCGVGEMKHFRNRDTQPSPNCIHKCQNEDCGYFQDLFYEYPRILMVQTGRIKL